MNTTKHTLHSFQGKFFLLIGILFFSFRSSFSQIKISGEITNGTGQVTLLPDSNYPYWDQASYSAELSGGKFELSGQLKKPGLAKLIYNDKSLFIYLTPGKEINLSSRANDFPLSTTFSSGNAEQTFLVEFFKQFGNDFDSLAIFERITSNTLDYFEMHIYENYQKEKASLENTKDIQSLSEEFKDWFKTEIKFHYYSQLLSYPIIHASTNKGSDIKELPEIMTEKIKPDLFQTAGGLNSGEFRKFVLAYADYTSIGENGFKDFASANEAMLFEMNIAKRDFPQDVYSWYLIYSLLSRGGNCSPGIVKGFYNELLTLESGSVYAGLVQKYLQAKMEEKEADTDKVNDEKEVKVKNKTYPFSATDLNGKPVSFDDFRGKIIYVDFWASWCGPCRAQAPAAKELHDRFSESQKKQIAFVYISIDQDENAWRKAIEQLGIEGNHSISPSNNPKGVGNYYNVSSIPRYMIIDKKGTIINENAPRPGDPTTYEILKKMLD